MNKKYLLFIRLIFAGDSNYIAIVQVFCYSLKKEWNVTYFMARRKMALVRNFFFIESRPKIRGIVRMGEEQEKGVFGVILYMD